MIIVDSYGELGIAEKIYVFSRHPIACTGVSIVIYIDSLPLIGHSMHPLLLPPQEYDVYQIE